MLAGLQPIGGFLDLEAHVLKNATCSFADHAAVVDDKAASHGIKLPEYEEHLSAEFVNAD